MRLAGITGRRFRLRRTVRSRMTLLYGALFLLSGAVLLAIASGVASMRSSTEAVGPAQNGAGGQSSPGGQSALARDNSLIRQLQSQLGTAQHSQSGSLTHDLLVGSLVALVIMAAASAVLGWLIAGHALRPLRTITATARRISEDNLHERLAFTGPDDELKRLADTIDELLERLESAFAAQRRFVANASHELRTPLATMRASLDVAMAKPDPIPAQTAALAGRLRAELDRVDDLLEGFLALARAQHGALPDAATFSLAGLAVGALGARAAAITGLGLLVRCEAGAGDIPVAGSRALISRMVANVIDNAIVHNEPGGWITVSAAAGPGTARLVVENGGAVLSADQVGQLAQPFRRVGPDRTGSDGGSGLGLSIVAAIASAHGGQLDLQARPGGGLRIVITLPLAVPAGQSAGQSASQSAGQAPPGGQGRTAGQAPPPGGQILTGAPG